MRRLSLNTSNNGLLIMSQEPALLTTFPSQLGQLLSLSGSGQISAPTLAPFSPIPHLPPLRKSCWFYRQNILRLALLTSATLLSQSLPGSLPASSQLPRLPVNIAASASCHFCPDSQPPTRKPKVLTVATGSHILHLTAAFDLPLTSFPSLSF